MKFDSKLAYGDNHKCMKTKIEISDGSLNINFQGKGAPKENAPYKSLLFIMLDSVVKTKKKYYPQTLLEECKYEPNKIKIENLDKLDKSSMMN